MREHDTVGATRNHAMMRNHERLSWPTLDPLRADTVNDCGKRWFTWWAKSASANGR